MTPSRGVSGDVEDVLGDAADRHRSVDDHAADDLAALDRRQSVVDVVERDAPRDHRRDVEPAVSSGSIRRGKSRRTSADPYQQPSTRFSLRTASNGVHENSPAGWMATMTIVPPRRVSS